MNTFTKFCIFILLSLLSACSFYNFNRQKHTDLKQLPATQLKIIHPPDSNQFSVDDTLKEWIPDIKKTQQVFLKTEKGYYEVEEAVYDSLHNLIKGSDIRRAREPRSDSIMILHITEENYHLIDAVEIIKIDSVYYEGKLIDKLTLQHYLEVRESKQLTSAEEIEHKEQMDQLTMNATVFFFLSILSGLMALLWYLAYLNNKDGGCVGIFISSGLYLIFVVSMIIMGVFALAFVSVLILILVKRKQY